MISSIEQHLDAIRALCQEYHVTRLDLFGSTARADFDVERSDVDLLVEFAAGADLGPWMARYFEFQARLEALLGRKVDLIMASSVRNPYLQRAIDQDRQELYAA